MDITNEPQRIISLCTGVRGIERGLERLGVYCRTVAYVEIEAFVDFNLVNQMEKDLLGQAPIWTDLKTFPWENFRGKVHGITGGYPCQPFSVAGKRGGTEDPRHLYPHISRGIEIVRPNWCLFENVPGHLSIGYREVRQDLERLGYTVKEGIFSAEEVGATHQRKRLFILAVENSFLTALRNKGRTFGGEFGIENVRQGEWEECSVWLGAADSMADSTSIGTSGKLRDVHQKDESLSRPEEQHEDESRKSVNASSDVEDSDSKSIRDDIERVHRETSRTGTVGDPNNPRGRTPEHGANGNWKKENERWEGQSLDRIGGSSEELANTNNTRKLSGPRQATGESQETEGTEQRGEWNEEIGERVWNESGNSSELVNSLNKGLQGSSRLREDEGEDIRRQESPHGSIRQLCSIYGDRWPSRPGTDQYDWEEPRLESKVGFTINGYNFREDFLRALGNGVVEHTAALAFLTLVNQVDEI